LKPHTWNDKAFEDRRDDVKATIDGLVSNTDFRGVSDAPRIGASGHSLGGYDMVGGSSRREPMRSRPRLGREVLTLSMLGVEDFVC
jgi:hypothetical protein